LNVWMLKFPKDSSHLFQCDDAVSKSVSVRGADAGVCIGKPLRPGSIRLKGVTKPPIPFVAPIACSRASSRLAGLAMPRDARAARPGRWPSRPPPPSRVRQYRNEDAPADRVVRIVECSR